jgi:phospholipase B1
MAGFAAEGIQGTSIVNIKSLNEYRGVSYGGGGDAGAVTVPNFIKKYSPTLKGSSVEEHLIEVCYGLLCPPFQCMYTTV